MPGSSFLLASWVSALGDNLMTLKTIKHYLSGVPSAHTSHGYSDLSGFDDPVLHRVIRGIKQLRGDCVPRERLPITRDILLELIATIDTSSRYGATLYASFCLAWAGVFANSRVHIRRKGFVRSRLRQLAYHQIIDCLLLRLPRAYFFYFKE